MKYSLFDDEALYGHISHKKMPKHLKLIGKSDFSFLQSLLINYKVDNIVTIRNNGTSKFFDLADIKLQRIFNHEMTKSKLSYKTIILVGASSIGKTISLDYLKNAFNLLNVRTISISDRQKIEELLLSYNNLSRSKNFGKILRNDLPGYRKFQVSEGSVSNRAYREMVDYISNIKKDMILIEEYCIGADVNFGINKEILYQSPKHFLNYLFNYGVFRNVLLIEIYTPFHLRRKWNLLRYQKTSSEFYSKLFPKTKNKYFSKEDTKKFGIKYYSIDNTSDNLKDLKHSLDKCYDEFIIKYISPNDYFKVRDNKVLTLLNNFFKFQK